MWLCLVLHGVAMSQIEQLQSPAEHSYLNVSLGVRYFPLPGMRDVTERSRAAIAEQARAVHARHTTELLLAMASDLDESSWNSHPNTPCPHEFALTIGERYLESLIVNPELLNNGFWFTGDQVCEATLFSSGRDIGLSVI